jgi:hypothetical protein
VVNLTTHTRRDKMFFLVKRMTLGSASNTYMFITENTVAVPATIGSGQGTLLSNTALGIVTASGKLVKVNSGAVDGSAKLAGVLKYPVNTASGDAAGQVIIIGAFPKGSLIYGSTDTDSTHFSVLGVATAGSRIYIY